MTVYETTVSFTTSTILDSTIEKVHKDFCDAFPKGVTNYNGLLKITGMLSIGGIIDMLNILELNGLTSSDIHLCINEPRIY